MPNFSISPNQFAINYTYGSNQSTINWVNTSAAPAGGFFSDQVRIVKQKINERGNFHCEDGPAVVYSNGKKVWYFNGNIHRTNGPAIEYSNGDKSWYLNGVLHR